MLDRSDAENITSESPAVMHAEVCRVRTGSTKVEERQDQLFDREEEGQTNGSAFDFIAEVCWHREIMFKIVWCCYNWLSLFIILLWGSWRILWASRRVLRTSD